MLQGQCIYPSRVPIVDRRVLRQSELFTVPVRAQVGTSLDTETPAVCTMQRDNLAMAPGCCCSLASGTELRKRFRPEVFVVVAEECGRKHRQPANRTGVQESDHLDQVLRVEAQRGNPHLLASSDLAEQSNNRVHQVVTSGHERVERLAFSGQNGSTSDASRSWAVRRCAAFPMIGVGTFSTVTRPNMGLGAVKIMNRIAP